MTFDLESHLLRLRAWSIPTFGPGKRTKGICDHIRKELKEIEADPDDVGEWIDVIKLGLDGAHRTGTSPKEICRLLEVKQRTNELRDWPDWRTADPDKAIEHVKIECEEKDLKNFTKPNYVLAHRMIEGRTVETEGWLLNRDTIVTQSGVAYAIVSFGLINSQAPELISDSAKLVFVRYREPSISL